MYQIHVWVRSPITGLSEWKALRPSGSKRPYLYASKEEAEKIGRLISDAGKPSYRIVEAKGQTKGKTDD